MSDDDAVAGRHYKAAYQRQKAKNAELAELVEVLRNGDRALVDRAHAQERETHPHEDHIGGFNALARAFRVGKVWDSGYEQGSRLQQSVMRMILKEGIRFGTPKAGFKETIGQAEIEILAPDRRWRGVGTNNNSVILRVAYGRVSFLMMGDAERAERENHALPKSDILKLAHHGSRTGTDAAHLAAIAPKLAVATFGNGNRYKHPHREVLDALRASMTVLYSTVSGDIVIDSDGVSFDVRQCAP